VSSTRYLVSHVSLGLSHRTSPNACALDPPPPPIIRPCFFFSMDSNRSSQNSPAPAPAHSPWSPLAFFAGLEEYALIADRHKRTSPIFSLNSFPLAPSHRKWRTRISGITSPIRGIKEGESTRFRSLGRLVFSSQVQQPGADKGALCRTLVDFFLVTVLLPPCNTFPPNPERSQIRPISVF